MTLKCDKHASDETKIACAFEQIYQAAMVINEVLGDNRQLNETVPANWPLNLSADEFAAECLAMKWHYEALEQARRDQAVENVEYEDR